MKTWVAILHIEANDDFNPKAYDEYWWTEAVFGDLVDVGERVELLGAAEVTEEKNDLDRPYQGQLP